MLAWLGVLVVESSNIGSSANTGALLQKVWTALLGAPDKQTFEFVHHLIRKTGHFTGYAILSYLIFRALRLTWRVRNAILARLRDYYWQFRWAAWGIVGTIMAASADEIHQSFNPNRTGRWQDVVIDTSGALTLQIFVYLYESLRGRNAEA